VIGKQIQHYKILDTLGEFGMRQSLIPKAEDQNHLKQNHRKTLIQTGPKMGASPIYGEANLTSGITNGGWSSAAGGY